MSKTAFVILHYIVIDETIKCVNSILDRVDSSKCEIVIVDNASPNDSGKELRKLYSDSGNIHVLINKLNYGFSKGNNIGYKYAKDVLKCDFIVVSNNDIILLDDKFLEKIECDYIDKKVAVIGPRIFTYEDDIGIQNPQWKSPQNDELRIRSLYKKRRDLHIAIWLSYFRMDTVFYTVKRKLGKKLKRENNISNIYFDNVHEGVQLHGCFWIFTPAYVSKYEGLEEITFMYHEEMLLCHRMERDNMKMLYDPDIKVFHAEKAATKRVSKGLSSSRRVRYKRELDSANSVIKYLKESI